MKDLIGNIKNIELYYCNIDTDVLQYMSENIDKMEYLEIRDEVEKYTDQDLSIVDELIKNMENFAVDIQ